MKRIVRKQRGEVDDVRDEYQFDYSQAKPNRFASRLTRPLVAVALESDVAALFDSSAKVNAQLRSAISALKHRKHLAELRKNLPQGPQKGPQADRIARQREVGKTVTPPRVNRLGA
jgi:hypothetical protein